eukprot:g2274.t1
MANYVRCTFNLHLSVLYGNEEGYVSAEKDEVDRFCQNLKSSTQTSFLFPGGAIYGIHNQSDLSLSEAIVKTNGNENNNSQNSKKRRKGKKGKGGKSKGTGKNVKRNNDKQAVLTDYSTSGLGLVLEIEAVTSISHRQTSDTHPFIFLHGAHCRKKVRPISLDVLVPTSSNEDLQTVLSKTTNALVEQLQTYVKHSDNSSAWRSFHFTPAVTGLDKCVTFTMAQISTVESRKALHTSLGLPLTSPIFLETASLGYCEELVERESSVTTSGKDWPLLNVHLGCPSPTFTQEQEVKVSMVTGSYKYYHYLQGGERDKGWGCAYRSLQTLLSWFRLNHYTSCPIPTHRETQQALVDLGDKKPSFVGSNQWIGSTELGYCLEKWCNVTCKFLFLSSGADFPSKARDLVRHFDTEGTPVMIGGGALAFTLLGVAFQPSTGDARFLILDPHYTGADDLSVIQRKSVSMEGYRAIPCKAKNRVS